MSWKDTGDANTVVAYVARPITARHSHIMSCHEQSLRNPGVVSLETKAGLFTLTIER